MTPQEQQLIDGLVERIRSTQVTDKDVTAEQHLQQGLAGYPDATYVMAQTIIVQQYGLQQAQSQLEQAQAQIADLKGQLDELRQHAATTPGTGGSFLSHLFGGNSPQASPANPPYQPVNNPGYGAGSQNYPPAGYPPAGYPPAAYPPAYAQPSSYAPAGGGFLRGALQTAAGVAAGEMAFASIESLFHGFGGGGGYGSGFGGGGFGEGRPEEVINNYYGDGTEHHGDHLADTSQDSGGSHNDGFGNDISSNQFADTQDSNANAFGDTDKNDQNYTGDDSTYDDSNFNDSSSDDSDDSSDFGGDDQS
jgi:hypothetical protein